MVSIRLLMLSSLALMATATMTQANTLTKDVEELRLPLASKTMPHIVDRYQGVTEGLNNKLSSATDELTMTQMVASEGHRLWQNAVKDVQSGHTDDRALYWSRLTMRESLKTQRVGYNIAPWQREILVSAIEKSSRGFSDIHFKTDTRIKILLTGFDPFFLDKDIGQSNPSGVTALALDGYQFNIDGKIAQIETVMIPVRFADFDKGIIESLLTPIYRDNSVDMIFTVSMGREQFDIERFPARNRSAAAPDNLNVLTGASKTNPLPPMLNNQPLNGPEFVEFSLPIIAMQKEKGHWQVNDNHQVSTIDRGQFEAKSLNELQSETSVEGSGGGYLSNEISYRSILLMQQFGRNIPVGHIHTPKVKGYDSQAEHDIVEQIKVMITAAAASL
jgi:pyrrolidone-carboxylate peptidase